ncbi:MAG: ParA family protein [Sinimarinibacterium flocculans]|jgi:chromosome partitioning protein|uniref:Cellulose biosynthesis protein BcsQ n=1 Tax=Sinimarinibacterium flocculans TaxID=985250 RepID=A0A318E704_9GAMM|nr:AAA family ATPase [Sinimarinibacterium flocculans]MEC9364654.1 AAA family ATPase [Pseudomonadota bacterium]PXV64935.1 cellulose biosynthesis protein BcsQ [Sinimarinibacterium flocculans]
MKTLALHNLKGGVGKTAAAVNLAYLAAANDVPTLLWDLDPQGAASWYFHGEPQEQKLKSVFQGSTPVGRLVVPSPYENLKLIPADLSYRYLDILLKKVEPPREALKRLLKPFSEQFALAVLDCPPSLSHLADNIFEAADMIAVPVVPTFLSLRALEQVQAYFKQEGLDVRKLRPFYSMADRRRGLHRELIEQPPLAMARALKAVIPYASMVERMGERRAPMAAYAPSEDPALLAYAELWLEVSAALRL